MSLIRNRKFAVLVLVICILISILGFGGSGLASMRADVVRAFINGIDSPDASAGGPVFSVGQYLKESAGYARVMAEEVKRLVNSESETAARVLSLVEIVDSDKQSVNDRVDAYKALTAAVESLYTEMHNGKISEADSQSFDRNYTNYTEDAASKIGYDGYNAVARAYNESVSGFPKSLIAKLLGIGQLGTL